MEEVFVLTLGNKISGGSTDIRVRWGLFANFIHLGLLLLILENNNKLIYGTN